MFLIHRSISSFNNKLFFTIVIAIFLYANKLELVNGLKINFLDIPSPLVYGDDAELTCNYDLEDNTLYSFKWYKDGIEFYRYVPRDFPKTQYLKMSGINVDLSKSTKKSVFLHKVNLNTRGKYRCEISAEAPSFVTAAKEGNLEVNVLPNQGPKIVHDKSGYTVGDEISVNCTSDKSNLESFLNFTINDQPVSNGFDYHTVYTTQLSADGLKTSILMLRFEVTPKHFLNGKMKLRCISSVAHYKMQNEAKLIVKDIKYKPEPMHIFSSESQARSEAHDNHDKSHLNEWKFLSVLFSMFIHRQLQRIFSA